MLGPTYRFTAYNATGQALAANAITIKPRRWKYGTDGSLMDETVGTADVLGQTGTMANATYQAGVTQDNTVNKYIGGVFEITATAPASSDGDITVYLEQSADGGATWPDNGLGLWVSTFSFTDAGTKRDVVDL